MCVVFGYIDSAMMAGVNRSMIRIADRKRRLDFISSGINFKRLHFESKEPVEPLRVIWQED